MRLTALLLTLLLAGAALGEPQDAVVRMRSHGASGTVIWTDGQTRSLILSCAHMWWGHNSSQVSREMTSRPIVIDGVAGDEPPSRLGRTRVLAIDSAADLSLIEVDIALPHVAPVALELKQRRNCVSIGFDDMIWPATQRPATILRVEGTSSLTREKPWHGRSGGALLDAETGELIGVCSGYECAPSFRRSSLTLRVEMPGIVTRSVSEEFTAQGRGDWREVDGYPGIYVSHAAILAFLKTRGGR